MQFHEESAPETNERQSPSILDKLVYANTFGIIKKYLLVDMNKL